MIADISKIITRRQEEKQADSVWKSSEIRKAVRIRDAAENQYRDGNDRKTVCGKVHKKHEKARFLLANSEDCTIIKLICFLENPKKSEGSK